MNVFVWGLPNRFLLYPIQILGLSRHLEIIYANSALVNVGASGIAPLTKLLSLDRNICEIQILYVLTDSYELTGYHDNLAHQPSLRANSDY